MQRVTHTVDCSTLPGSARPCANKITTALRTAGIQLTPLSPVTILPQPRRRFTVEVVVPIRLAELARETIIEIVLDQFPALRRQPAFTG